MPSKPEIPRGSGCSEFRGRNGRAGAAEGLGVAETVELYCDPTGEFPHNPEPLPEHLKDLCDRW
jgi:hypothetical protein